jgi:hypothetical protein
MYAAGLLLKITKHSHEIFMLRRQTVIISNVSTLVDALNTAFCLSTGSQFPMIFDVRLAHTH